MSDTHKCGLERHYSTDYELNFQKIVENVCFVCPRAMLSLLSICLQVLQIIRHLVFNYRKIIVSAVSGWNDGW